MHCAEFRQSLFHFPPDPPRQIFAGGIFQTLHLVEIAVIELIEDRFERFGDFGVIPDPSPMRVDGTFKMQGYPEGMTVQPAAFMAIRKIGQAVGSLDPKLLGDLHAAHDCWTAVVNPSLRSS